MIGVSVKHRIMSESHIFNHLNYYFSSVTIFGAKCGALQRQNAMTRINKKISER